MRATRADRADRDRLRPAPRQARAAGCEVHRAGLGPSETALGARPGPVNRPLTMSRFARALGSSAMATTMAQTAAPERSNFFLSRCNLKPSTRLHEVAEPSASTRELSFRIATDEVLGLMGE